MQYAGAKGPVHLSRVVCSGNESSLLECHHQKENGRGPGSWFGRDIGVSCGTFCCMFSFGMPSNSNALHDISSFSLWDVYRDSNLPCLNTSKSESHTYS